MKKSYAQIAAEIQALEKDRADLDKLVQHIKEAIAAHSLTTADLGLEAGGPVLATAKKARKGPARALKRKGKKRLATAYKYADDAGNGWGGRGPRPQWLRDALAKGKTLEDFAV